MSQILDSSVSPTPAGVAASSSGLVTQSSDVYVISTGQKIKVWNASGSLSANAVGDEGFLSPDSVEIVAELYSDPGASNFIGDIVLARGQSAIPLKVAGSDGFALRSDFVNGPILEIDNGIRLVGNAVAQPGVTVQSVLFILEAVISNSDAAGHDANLSLVVQLSIEQLPVV